MLYLLHVLLVGVVQKRQIFLKMVQVCVLGFTGLSFMACQFCHPIGELYVEQLRIAGFTCE